MKFISVQKNFEGLGCPLLHFSVIATGDTQKLYHPYFITL